MGTLTLKKQSAASVPNAATDTLKIFVDVADSVVKTKDNTGTVAVLAGGGGFGDTTDDQTVQTTDATVTTIATYSTLLDNMAVSMQAYVWAYEPATGDSAKYVIESLFRRDGSSVVTSKDENFVSIYEDQPAWDVTFNISAQDIQVQVTGEAAKTIEWRCVIGVSEHG